MVQPKVHNEVTYYCQNNDGFLLIINSLEPSFIKEEIEMDEYDDDIITNIIETNPFIPIPPEEKFALSLYHTATFKYDELFDTQEIIVEDMPNRRRRPNPLIPLVEHLTAIENSSCKGILGEYAVERILKSKYGEDRVIVTREMDHYADLMLNLPNLSISIEIKNCSRYKSDHTNKFCYDLSLLHEDPKIPNLFGLIVYIQNNTKSKTKKDKKHLKIQRKVDNNDDNIINNLTVKKINADFINSNLLAIDFLELFDTDDVINRMIQKRSSLSDGFKYIYEMAGKHKLLITVEELTKYRVQEEENKKLKEKLSKSEKIIEQYKKTLKSVLILVNTPTPF